jgi:ABC-type arginine transport system ATPase subunit
MTTRVRPQPVANGAQQALRVDDVGHDVEGGDHVIMLGQSGGGVEHLEPDGVADAGVLDVAAAQLDAVR